MYETIYSDNFKVSTLNQYLFKLKSEDEEFLEKQYDNFWKYF